MRVAFFLRGAGLLSLAGVLTGCGANPVTGTSPLAGAKLTGRVQGGQQPIVGARVYLLAANTTGYGGPGIAASASNASISLLTGTGNSDSIGGYVPSSTLDSSGNVWVADVNGAVEKLVGMGAPVVTPLSVAVKNNQIATAP